MPLSKIIYNISRHKSPALYIGLAGAVFLHQLSRLRARFISTNECKKLTTDSPEYIYIDELKNEELLRKFDVDGLVTNELYKITQLYLWITAKVRGSELYEAVFSWHQNLAWKYLLLARDENPSFRQFGVRSLALMSNVSDATCVQIAQASDLRTSVGVARTEGCNERLLLDPPSWKLPVDETNLLHELHEFMLKLDKDSHHPCVQFVIARTFAEKERDFDDDLSVNNIRRNVITDCMNAVLHHSWLPEHCSSIVNHGGLALIVDVYKTLDVSQLDGFIAISRILSNISMHPDCHNLLYISGCIKILVKLLRHEDARVSIPAARALMNCDADDRNGRFGRNLYQLHPVHRLRWTGRCQARSDVIFIHGLLGSAFVTWRQRDLSSKTTAQNDAPVDGADKNVDINSGSGSADVADRKRSQCWPKDWLPQDCPDVRVLGVNYDTNISLWSPSCPISPKRPTLSDRSSALLSALKTADVGCRPIVWVAHSMGGLIVKRLLVQCSESSDAEDQAILKRTAGVVFFSTPHRGSRLAKLSSASQMILWPTIEVQELSQDSPALLELHNKFLKLTKNYPIKILSFAERLPTLVRNLQLELRFVDDRSSYIETGQLYGMPLDHLCICKPETKHSFIYKKVVDLIGCQR